MAAMPLRVLHVVPYFEAAWAYGGIPRVVGPLTHALADRGLEVTVCTTDVGDRHSRWRPGPPDGLDVRVFPNLSNTAAYHLQLFLPRGMSAWLRRRAGSFDLAHLHGCHHLPGAHAAAALREAGVPWILTPHGTAPYRDRQRLAKRVFASTVGRRVLPEAAAVIAVSEAERRTLERFGVAAERIRVLPNPMPVDELVAPPRGRFRHRLGLGDGPVVLFLGQLTAQKRVDVVLDAVARLDDGVRLVVAGNDMGAGSALRRRARRLGLDARAAFPGLLRGPERLEALADADVVAYPSRGEVFGLVPLEALLCGTPVVVADDGGCGEMVSRVGGGRMVRIDDAVDDAGSLADALAAVLGDPEAARRAARDAAARLRRLVDVRTVARATEELYASVLDGRPGRRLAEAA